MTTVSLPVAGGTERLVLSAPAKLESVSGPSVSRTAYAAAHVVADPYRASASDSSGDIDWDTTLQLRHNLWERGLGVAEAMDTAQRGMGLDWPRAQELIDRTLKESQNTGGAVVVGMATDQLPDHEASLDAVRRAYLEQLAFIEERGGTAVMMASRHLARGARNAEDYLRTYSEVLGQASRPVVLHWLGEAFDPALAGYWGSRNIDEAMETVLELIRNNTSKIAGIKVSLLEPAYEIALRKALPASVKLFTGDDFNYVDLIAGDAKGFSHALLGAFGAIPAHASAALAALGRGDESAFRAILEPTVPLSRLIFAAPTQYYKTGVVFLAYLNGQQDHFRMIGGLESGRNLLHLADLLRAGNNIGLFDDPELTAARAASYFAAQGIR
ncbi:dihydrodipicolinate synthase family protein [Arthrobacter mobilis]|uniref:Dihydrodipicolinate synthase family protein n=1 Tax=Arthrobacter mobilis TaxID=2724944 RepID=A0A7X6HG23_9MICC|nr:dihydrodipicolinate synthase family protein [Arthrobacter mobilis]NKX55544.1 dihydrodipicolinate synthase family protein [Arthrobacter mobilis]